MHLFDPRINHQKLCILKKNCNLHYLSIIQFYMCHVQFHLVDFVDIEHL